MDRQTSDLQIPVNTRTVGKPGGIYILYLEDYVYTFINRLFDEKNASESGQIYEISLFGRRYEEEGRSLLVISGAAQEPFPEDKGRQYFPSCSFLGNARVETNKDLKLRLEVTIKDTNIVLDDFYIYYDQNEEMQNYLIEWNFSHKSSPMRAETDEAVRYGRIAQAYNREEAKVSFIWNVMNILCLGLVLGIMGYGIISINNYQKMKSMEKNIDYCMTLITETIRQNNFAAVNSGNVNDDNDNNDKMELMSGEESAQNHSQEGQPQASATESELEEHPEETVVWNNDATVENNVKSDTAKYYIVQRGDTLRNISYKLYGTYDMVDRICEYNKIENPDNILCGQRLLLP